MAAGAPSDGGPWLEARRRLPPVFDHDLGFGEVKELLDVEQFVSDAGVEALDVRVLPR